MSIVTMTSPGSAHVEPPTGIEQSRTDRYKGIVMVTISNARFRDNEIVMATPCRRLVWVQACASGRGTRLLRQRLMRRKRPDHPVPTAFAAESFEESVHGGLSNYEGFARLVVRDRFMARQARHEAVDSKNRWCNVRRRATAASDPHDQ
jgi:hypothetical protein